MNTSGSNESTETLHGITLGTGHDDADIRLRHGSVSLPPNNHAVWSSDQVGERFRSRQNLHRVTDGWIVDVACEGSGRFLIREHEIVIDWDGGTGADHYLQTFGLAVWLELHDVLCLHASTVARDGTAIGFLAPSQTGKSTLVSQFIADGWQLVNDDMAAVRPVNDAWLVSPSRDEIRLWPDVGRARQGAAFDVLPPVHRRFAKRVVPVAAKQSARHAVPLCRLYLLERVADCPNSPPVEIVALNPAEATLALLRNSILGDAATALGIEAVRLARLASLVSDIPVLHVRYPTGLAHLERVRHVIQHGR